MADLYKRSKAYCDLIDVANGLPKGTSNPNDFTEEELCDLAARLARAINVFSWGLTGVFGLMMAADNTVRSNTYRKKMKFYDFPWQTFFQMVRVVDAMVEVGEEPDPLVEPKVAYAVFHDNRRRFDLSVSDKKMMWQMARAGGWNDVWVKRVLKNLEDFRMTVPERADELSEVAIEAARRAIAIEQATKYPRATSMVGDAVSGEGDRPAGD